MGKHKSNELRKEQIVRGLMKIMGERGYERSSIAAIAKAANLRSGLVHYYFSSKQEILLALVELLAEGLEQRYALRMQSAETSPEARLNAFIDAYVGAGEDALPEAVICWVVIGGEALHLEEAREAYVQIIRKTLEHLKLHIVEWLASEGKQTSNVHLLAAGIMSAIEGAYKLASISPDLVPSGFAAPTIKLMAKGLIKAQPPRKPDKREQTPGGQPDEDI